MEVLAIVRVLWNEERGYPNLKYSSKVVENPTLNGSSISVWEDSL